MGASNYRDCPSCGAIQGLREDYEVRGEGYDVIIDYQCCCKKFYFEDEFEIKNTLG